MKNHLFLIVFLILWSCETHYLPKPKGYNHIVLPSVSYTQLMGTRPYTFEYSTHAKILKDTSWIAEPNWIHIYYPYLSFAEMNVPKYKEVSGSMKNAFGVQRLVPVVEPPKAKSIIAKQYRTAKVDPTLMDVIQEQTTDEEQRKTEIK